MKRIAAEEPVVEPEKVLRAASARFVRRFGLWDAARAAERA